MLVNQPPVNQLSPLLQHRIHRQCVVLCYDTTSLRSGDHGSLSHLPTNRGSKLICLYLAREGDGEGDWAVLLSCTFVLFCWCPPVSFRWNVLSVESWNEILFYAYWIVAHRETYVTSCHGKLVPQYGTINCVNTAQHRGFERHSTAWTLSCVLYIMTLICGMRCSEFRDTMIWYVAHLEYVNA